MNKSRIRIQVIGYSNQRNKPFKSSHIYTHFLRYF